MGKDNYPLLFSVEKREDVGSVWFLTYNSHICEGKWINDLKNNFRRNMFEWKRKSRFGWDDPLEMDG